MTTKYCRQLGGKGEGVVKVTRLGWLRWGSKFFLNGVISKRLFQIKDYSIPVASVTNKKIISRW